MLLKRLFRKPLRTLLTLLQIVLGSLAMTLALSAYLDAYQRQQAAKPERFDLVAGCSPEDNLSFCSAGAFFDNKSVKELLRLTPDVADVAQYAIGDGLTLEKDNKLYEVLTAAYVEPNYFDLNTIRITRGSIFTSAESTLLEPVLLISDGTAKILFGDTNPVGQMLKVMTPIVASPDGSVIYTGGDFFPFTVIGTFAENGDVRLRDNYIYLPMWKADRPAEGGASILNVLAKPGRGEEAREQVLGAARQIYRDKYEQYGVIEGRDFYIREMGKDIGSYRPDGNYLSMIDPTVLMFGLFGIVSLIVGSIGIFSITLVDALERQRDTGIKRALGATRAIITREMVLESALSTGLGGLLGISLAALMIPWLSSQIGSSLFSSVNLRWQPWAAVIVFVLTVFLGTVLGFFPALRAARVNPVEALKGV